MSAFVESCNVQTKTTGLFLNKKKAVKLTRKNRELYLHICHRTQQPSITNPPSAHFNINVSMRPLLIPVHGRIRRTNTHPKHRQIPQHPIRELPRPIRPLTHIPLLFQPARRRQQLWPLQVIAINTELPVRAAVVIAEEVSSLLEEELPVF